MNRVAYSAHEEKKSSDSEPQTSHHRDPWQNSSWFGEPNLGISV
ncbi:hypothetical protein RESH_04590 [Rhodopirellula europaea SH398]|uniref:Uncharacterized protein n=1 Tax=Rhodopirellula europaea SH398 TaxID=1263868 RepID=M5SFA3_9BACT|nr:hypothetical protein RESH_04590 [Rhodopirellula europaea SH398]